MSTHRSTSEETTCGPITIVHADEQIIIIDKPAAMLTHPHPRDPAAPTVVDLLRRRYPGVANVHRLDRMTTGAMVLARTPDAARELSRQFRDREVGKRYLAIVRGHTQDQGSITVPLEQPANGEEVAARTDYRTIAGGRVAEPIGRYEEGWFSLVELTLHTGRTHQARRHLHRINHPVLGDTKHGDKNYNRWATAKTGEKHLYLRATELSFRHPRDGEPVMVRLGLPENWMRLLETVGISEVSSTLQGP